LLTLGAKCLFIKYMKNIYFNYLIIDKLNLYIKEEKSTRSMFEIGHEN